MSNVLKYSLYCTRKQFIMNKGNTYKNIRVWSLFLPELLFIGLFAHIASFNPLPCISDLIENKTTKGGGLKEPSITERGIPKLLKINWCSETSTPTLNVELGISEKSRLSKLLMPV